MQIYSKANVQNPTNKNYEKKITDLEILKHEKNKFFVHSINQYVVHGYDILEYATK